VLLVWIATASVGPSFEVHACLLLDHVRRFMCSGVEVWTFRKGDLRTRCKCTCAKMLCRQRRCAAGLRFHVRDIVTAEAVLNGRMMRQWIIRRSNSTFGDWTRRLALLHCRLVRLG
jgi:hypothetical protein